MSVKDDCRMVTYLVDRNFSGKPVDEKKQFCEKLLDYSDEVKEIFGNPNKYEKPVLECLELYVSQCNNQHDITQLINNNLKECNQTPINLEDDDSPYYIKAELDKKEGYFNLDFNDRKSFKPAFIKISAGACEKVRLIAHFLLDYNDIQPIFIDYKTNVKERLSQVLERWREKTLPEKRTWNCLKAILIFLNKYDVVKKIERNNDTDSVLFELYRNNRKSWEKEKKKQYAADIPMNTPNNWSIVHSFVECRDNKGLHKKEILRNITTEVTENLEWYQEIFVGDLLQMVNDYVSTGHNSQKNGELISNVLANAYRQSIKILKKDENGFYRLMDDNDIVFPDRIKQSLGIVHFYVDEDYCFHPLVNVREKSSESRVETKCNIEVLYIKDTYFIVEIPDMPGIDAIILEESDLNDESKVKKLKFDFDDVEKETHGTHMYILIRYNLIENKNYQCSLHGIMEGVALTSRKFLLEEKVFERMEYEGYTIISHKEKSSRATHKSHIFEENFLCCQSKSDGKELKGSEWISCCDKYVGDNLLLKDKSYSREWTIFPNIYMVISKNETQEIAECFKDALLAQTNKKSAGGIIFLNYNSSKHKSFLLKDKCEDIKRKFNNRLLILHEDLGAILNIRVTEKTDRKDIMNECLASSQDADDIAAVMDFLLYHENFGGSKVKVASFVAATNLKTEDLDTKLFNGQSLICDGCASRVLTRTDFDPDNHYRNLQEWLKTLPTILKSSNDSPHSPHSQKFIRKIISQIAGFMANTSIQVPCHSNDPHRQLMNLQANKDQIQVIIDPRKHKVIYAPFGCGKTIVGMQQSEFLARMADKPTILFYISCDPYSFLDYTIEKHLKGLKLKTVEDGLVKLKVTNVSQLAVEMGKKIIPSISDIMKHIQLIQEREKRICHVCVDELNLSELTEDEVLLINENLVKLSVNYVTLILQPFHNKQGKGKETWRFWKAKKNESKTYHQELNMVTMKLSKNMRNSGRIHQMLEVGKKKVSATELRFYQPKEFYLQSALSSAHSREWGDASENLPSPIKSLGANAAIAASVNSKLKPEEEETSETWPSQTESVGSTNSLHSNLNPPSVPLPDMNAIESLKQSENHNVERTTEYTSISQKFEMSDGVGHNFDGKLPQVLFMPSLQKIKKNLKYLDTRNRSQMKVLQLAICLQSVNYGDTIICHDRELLNFIQYALDVTEKRCIYYTHYMKGTMPSIDEKKKVADAMEKGKEIIVADSNGCRGLQIRRVVIPLQSNEKYLQYSILENAARATTEVLFIIVDVTKFGVIISPSTFGTVIKTWISKKLVERCKPNLKHIDLARLLIRLPTESELVEGVAIRELPLLPTFDDLDILIRRNEVSKLRSLVESFPSIVKMRGGYYNNETLLMRASSHFTPSCVQVLLEGGADVKEVDKGGNNVIHECVRKNFIDGMRIFLHSAPPDVVNSGNRFHKTPLHIASSKGHIECVKELLQYQHIDIDVKDVDGNTAYDVVGDEGEYYTLDKQEYNLIRELLLQYKK